ncbi:hypothetical protein [Radiobacillus deserti]|uniref:Uncharacterized protein n=1 Tax=Radiobacillus deserti TaxID=2594883 RepID=A0A516KJD0_9BACI|nr:hypothetical protein [Radiobacillus deserti]QDP41495.1 hypothetical protein FN924_15725 [Radiobacillus deserti]
MKKLLLVFIVWLFLCSQIVSATPYKSDVVSNFIHALITKGEDKAEQFLSSDVEIPEIRENTRIKEILGLPTSKDNVHVSVAYIDDGEDEPKRIAFIWEIMSTKDKITNIKVVYDGSNPFMNESNIIQEYRKKHGKKILGIAEFPIDVTHIDGEMVGDKVTINYRSTKHNAAVQLEVVPEEKELESLKEKNTKIYYLKNGTKALLAKDSSSNPTLVFLHGEMRYTISMVGKKFYANDFIFVANSMFIEGLDYGPS